MNRRTVRGVAFDLEGTILSVEEIHFGGFIRAAGEFGLTISFAELRAQIPHAIGGGDLVIAQGLARFIGGGVNADQILACKRRHYWEALNGTDIEPRPGWREVFGQITGTLRLPVAIGSLTPRDQAEVLLERSGVGELISSGRTVLLEDVSRRKPAPDVWHRTAELLGIDPADQLVFEDSPAGVEAARAAGCMVVVVPYHRFPELLYQLVASGAHRLFMDWRELNLLPLIENLEAESL
ncbi:MAG: hypothetical protein COU11_01400 [Candidatus Harrisonbacteria bacterium CG10_big_fil_rev_8_21_14_0_10_49_15]|uniref:HAD family phosphatase n=1 Tax=Candidatus Harrisonbacteria bacterium CG10_big_fil_rev_8_21_14_0_10_49_15 TaxID=1974587 RepID=A0A2H0UNP1_9BACT|nr:MAG: hypothetical protein COU11_01400 [Candidatus Harrisonbacteria bacterium CG10_big_fil_rev_8_21_14_0_10_49_15]